VLYEMATDRRAFPEELASRLIDAILHRAPVAPRALNPRISPELERIILKCLDKDPARRYQSAKELSVDLRRLGEPSRGPASDVEEGSKFKANKRVTIAAILIALILVGSVATGSWLREKWRRTPEIATFNQPVKSIAIIPFRNAGLDKTYDYFGVGLADVLNAKLTNARIVEVHAVPLPTKPTDLNQDPLQTGRRLGVDAIVSGSYQIEDGKLSLRYTLVDLRRQVQVAGNDFEAPFTRSIDAEHELAAQITDSLHGSVSNKDRTRFTSASTEQNDAFQAYLRSSYEMEVFWRQPSAAQLDRAEQDLQEALRFDPRFGLALVSLARLHWLAAFWGYADDPKILDNAEHEANRAIELQPDSGEPYAALSLVQIQKGNIGDARKSIQAAFTRSRNSALAYYAAGLYYMTKGLAIKSIPCFQKAQQLNPELIRSELGLAYRSQGDFLRARDELRQDLDSHPNDRVTAAVLAGVLIGLDDITGAKDIEETLLSRTPDDPTVRYVQALLQVHEGKPFSIESWLLRYQKVYWVDPGYCFDVAAVYAAAQQPSLALHWLRRARELGATNYPFVSQNPLFNSLRKDPAFQSFLESTERDWESANREEERDSLISGILGPTPAAYSTVSLTPSRESCASSFSSTNAAVQKGAKPSQVATKQNVWQKCPASNNTTRYALEKW
jgi:eukaryotic-like serine/threonine-protein kinase